MRRDGGRHHLNPLVETPTCRCDGNGTGYDSWGLHVCSGDPGVKLEAEGYGREGLLYIWSCGSGVRPATPVGKLLGGCTVENAGAALPQGFLLFDSPL